MVPSVAGQDRLELAMRISEIPRMMRVIPISAIAPGRNILRIMRTRVGDYLSMDVGVGLAFSSALARSAAALRALALDSASATS